MSYIFREIKNLDEIISTYISMKIKDVKLFLSRGAILAKTYFVVGLLAIIIYDDVQGVPRYLNLCHPFCYNAEATSSAASLKTDYRT